MKFLLTRILITYNSAPARSWYRLINNSLETKDSSIFIYTRFSLKCNFLIINV